MRAHIKDRMDDLKELKDLFYQSQFLVKHYRGNKDVPTVPHDRFLAELDFGVDHIKKNIVGFARYIQYMWNGMDEISYMSMEIRKLLKDTLANKNLKMALSTNFKLETETIHTEMEKEELVRAVLYFFKNDNYNIEPAFMYLAPLQSDLREMITLFDLTEQDYDQLMQEIVNPVMTRAEYYTSTAGILFELLRKKQMKAQWKHLEDIKC